MKPTKNKIWNFWNETLGEEFIEDATEICMACGSEETTDRAHILAKQCEGSNEPSNYHLLCKRCHGESEYMCGANYWLWFNMKNYLYNKGTIIPLEYENGKTYQYVWEMETKFNENKNLIINYLRHVDWFTIPRDAPICERMWSAINPERIRERALFIWNKTSHLWEGQQMRELQ